MLEVYNIFRGIEQKGESSALRAISLSMIGLLTLHPRMVTLYFANNLNEAVTV